MSGRYITVWPKNVLEWDHYVSDFVEDVPRLIDNLKDQGVKRYHTFALGDRIPSLSSDDA